VAEDLPLTRLPSYRNTELIGADFAAHVFPDAGTVEIRLTLLDDIWREIQSLCTENEWSLEEGLRIIMANGLAWLKEWEEDGTAARVRYANLSSQYAVMKFRAFQYLQAAQTLDMKINALRSEGDMLRSANEHLRAELQRLDGSVSAAPQK